MAFKHGKNTEVLLEGVDISGFLNDLVFGADIDTAETTTFKKDWKTHIPGAAGAKLEMKGFYDPDLDDITTILGAVAGNVLTVAPAGAEAVGDLVRLVQILTTSYGESSPVGGAVAFAWGVIGDGAAGMGVSLHPLAAETADGNGTTHTGPVGGTTTGAIAHLHVTSVSASDSIVVSIEDSANGSDWLAVASGAFASKAAAGSERLVIPGTIRRYTRAVWDVTGAGVSITFSVALART